MSLLRDFHRPNRWLALWIGAIVAVMALSLIPPPPMAVPDHFDKVEHLLGYWLLSAGAVQLFARPRTQLWAALGLVAMGIALELAQSAFTQTRVGDAVDALANTTGVALGMLLSLTPMARWLQRLDARLG